MDDHELDTRLAGIEAQLTVLAKEVRNIATAWRDYLALAEKGTQFFTGVMQNQPYMQRMSDALLPHLPPVDEKVVKDPTSALRGVCGQPPIGALSQEEVAELLRANEQG